MYLRGAGPRICWKTCCGGREEKALGDTKTWTLRNWSVPAGVGEGREIRQVPCEHLLATPMEV